MILTLASRLPAQDGAVGLSGVRGQRFANEPLVVYGPEPNDELATSLAVGDFNGDGADDLAASAPEDNNAFGAISDSGIVVVRYGIPAVGLNGSPANDVLSQAVAGSPDPAEALDGLGAALAACDLNGDGYDDLAIGIPFETVFEVPEAGAVQLHFGSADGLPAAADLLVSQSTSGVPGGLRANTRLGISLACGDIDGDGRDDLMVGSVNGQVSGSPDLSGFVIVLPGAPLGLDFDGSYLVSQNSPGIVDQAHEGDRFGFRLAAGDFDGDGFVDLLAGVPEERDSTGSPCGAAHLIRGSAGGLTATGNRLWRESDLGSTCEDPSGFGSFFGVGDFDGDGRDDVLLGIPGKSFGGTAIPEAGQVLAVRGGDGGLDASTAQRWVENLIYGPGHTEAFDRFGLALAAGDFDGDGFDDAVIAHPGESHVAEHDGAVSILMGGPEGISADRYRLLRSGASGTPGVPDQPNRFHGVAVATGDFDGDGCADLGIGAPDEDENGLEDVGALVVLYGSLFADGFETATTELWSNAVP